MSSHGNHNIIQIMLLQHLQMRSAKECHRVLLPMEDRIMRERPDLIGNKYGMPTVIGQAPSTAKG